MLISGCNPGTARVSFTVEQKSEAKVRQNFDEVIDGIIRVLFPFREAYDAVVAFLTMKAEEEKRNQLSPVVA